MHYELYVVHSKYRELNNKYRIKNGGMTDQYDISNLRFQISLKCSISNEIDVTAGNSTNIEHSLQIDHF